MKSKYIILFALFFVFMSSFSQNENGNNIVLGGSLITKYSKPKDSKKDQFQFGFEPRIGYLINKKIEIGINIGVNYAKGASLTGYSYGTNPVSKSFMYGVYSRLYFVNKNKFAAFIGFYFDKENIESNADNIESAYKSNYLNIGSNGGLIYSIADKIDMECTFGLVEYSHIKSPDTSYKENAFKLTLDLTAINLGIRFRI